MGECYACSFHTNRGSTICPNGKVVRRTRLEEHLLQVIQTELFTPEAVSYLTKRVREALELLASQRATGPTWRASERELAQALKEREYIKNAIRRGLIGEITREMLEDVETRIQRLQAQLNTPAPTESVVVSNLPRVIQTKLSDLGTVLGRDVERSRTLLHNLLGTVVLMPTSKGLVAELRGNVEGLLSLEKALITGNRGSGGLQRAQFFTLRSAAAQRGGGVTARA